uniref:C-type lectin domain-containing protein n=1 Tax=Caenorhabditis tropicalis TaxID=1561998 RepID=A0A1I7TVR9_9PELO
MRFFNKDAPPPYTEREENDKRAVENTATWHPLRYQNSLPEENFFFILIVLILVVSISVFLILFLNKTSSCDYRVANKCLKIYNVSMDHDDAYSTCKGRLLTAKTYSDDVAINTFFRSQSIDNVWMGLKCTGGTVSSCVWDNKFPLNYNSFSPGFPDANLGQCVVYRTSSNDQGEWVSSQYEWMARIVCED